MLDLSEVRGQAVAKRAMEIAAAGGHHILLVGPSGCGKSMLATAFAGLLPHPLSRQRDRTDMAGQSSPALIDGPFTNQAVVAPPPSSSRRSLIGMFGKGQVGDLVRADQGLLILDDLDRFPKTSLALVREVMERGEVRYADGSTKPTRFQLFTTLRTCPCGKRQAFQDPCGSDALCQIDHQWRAVKGYVDIVDLQVMMNATQGVDWDGYQEETSTVVLERVESARKIQKQRGKLNAHINGSPWHDVCALDRQSAQLIDDAIVAQSMSGRDCAAVLRVARTLADLEKSHNIRRIHVAEAMIYRLLRSRYE